VVLFGIMDWGHQKPLENPSIDKKKIIHFQ
jgi:hypothetical protein